MWNVFEILKKRFCLQEYPFYSYQNHATGRTQSIAAESGHFDHLCCVLIANIIFLSNSLLITLLPSRLNFHWKV